MKRTIAFLAASNPSVWRFLECRYTSLQRNRPNKLAKELEPVAKASNNSLRVPLAPHQHYAITFTGREEFESAWGRIILKLKTPKEFRSD